MLKVAVNCIQHSKTLNGHISQDRQEKQKNRTKYDNIINIRAQDKTLIDSIALFMKYLTFHKSIDYLLSDPQKNIPQTPEKCNFLFLNI